MAISNIELWNAARKLNPSFAAHTAEGTADLFTEKGFAALTNGGADTKTLNEFFGIIMPYVLNQLNVSHAKDPLAEAGFGETYETPYGGYLQRIAINSIKPVSPAYTNLVNGQSIDPYVIRKPEITDRFFDFNYNYQSAVTMPDDYEVKSMFVSENGIAEYMQGIFAGMENGYILQEYLNKLEAINGAINNPKLRASQKVEISISDTPTAEELLNIQAQIMNTIELMTMAAQTGDYNALGFESTQDKDRLHLLVRPGYKTALALELVRGSYNAETLDLGIQIDVVPHFGGLIPYQEAAFTNQLYPVYDKMGAQIGWNTQEDQTEVTVQLGEEFYKDPNADVFCVLADKGLIFEGKRTPYTVEPIRNPRGRYTNYWASSPKNTIKYDALYNLVKFTKAEA